MYLQGTKSIWREQNLLGGNEIYLEGTILISRERNVFRGNEIYFEGAKYIWKDPNIYISMERNNISEFPHVPLGAPYKTDGRCLYIWGRPLLG